MLNKESIEKALMAQKESSVEDDNNTKENTKKDARTAAEKAFAKIQQERVSFSLLCALRKCS